MNSIKKCKAVWRKCPQPTPPCGQLNAVASPAITHVHVGTYLPCLQWSWRHSTLKQIGTHTCGGTRGSIHQFKRMHLHTQTHTSNHTRTHTWTHIHKCTYTPTHMCRCVSAVWLPGHISELTLLSSTVIHILHHPPENMRTHANTNTHVQTYNITCTYIYTHVKINNAYSPKGSPDIALSNVL